MITAATLKQFAATHIFYILLIAGGVFGFHEWNVEHTARIQAEASIKASEVIVANLQQQIIATNAAAAAKVTVITKIVHDVTTPTQAVIAIPQLTAVPLNARPAVDSPVQVSVDAIPLVAILGQAKIDKTNLDACTSNLTAEAAIVAQKDQEIVILKKKKPLFKRIEHGVEIFAVGVITALVLVH
jgi:hypothetical protein